jgi:uncharacterized protein (DUF488 family)
VQRIQQLALPTESFPAQARNKAAWNALRAREAADFFTIGYTQRDIVAFMQVLKDAGVMTVLDIRHSAVSMYKPDFSKGNLRRHLASAGIDYIHLPRFGVPKDIRSKAAGESSRQLIWDWYSQYVVPFLNLHSFFNSGAHPVALLCLELDPTSCHRHLLALKLEQHGLRGHDL